MDNKIAAHTYKMIDASSDTEKSNRMAVIVDNRYTKSGAKAKDGNADFKWTLSAKADDFKPENETATVNALTTDDVQVLINDSISDEGTPTLTCNVPISQNKKGLPDKIYKPGTGTVDLNTVDMKLADPATDILKENGMIAQSNSSKTPGPTAINFANNASAEFVVLPGDATKGIAKIVPNTKYISNITWTLSSDPLH